VVLCAPHGGQQGRRGLGEREGLGSADGGTRGRGGQRRLEGEGAAQAGRRRGAAMGLVPDAISGEGCWKYALKSTGFDPLVGSDGFDPLWCKSPNGPQML
jgi:hypothetical protein